jgi:hypothetical protein
MSYILGFTVQKVGHADELTQWATKENLAKAEKLDGEIGEHNQITSELDQLIADVSNRALQSDPVGVKERILTQPVKLGPAGLLLLERKAGLLAPLMADFRPWQIEKQKTLNEKWSGLEKGLAALGADPHCSEARQLIALLCWDESQAAHDLPFVFDGLQDGYIVKERAEITHAIHQSMRT